jgi:hypothetical protein
MPHFGEAPPCQVGRDDDALCIEHHNAEGERVQHVDVERVAAMAIGTTFVHGLVPGDGVVAADRLKL